MTKSAEKKTSASTAPPPHSPWADRPIFIWGMQKTGSSLLQSLIDGHPSLVVYPVELHIKYYIGRSSKETEAELRRRYLLGERRGRTHNRLRATVAKILAGEKAGLETLPHEAVVAAFDSRGYGNDLERAMGVPLSQPADLFRREITSFFANLKQPPRDPVAWAFKMVGGDPSMGDVFLSQFPGGRIIYIVRDPRGGASSRLKAWQRAGKRAEEKELLAFMLKYRGHYRWLASRLRRGPDERLLILRYEDLVANTEDMMRQACDFIGVPFDACTLMPTMLGTSARVWNATVEKPGVYGDSAQDWRTHLSPRQILLVETLFRDFWNGTVLPYRSTLPAAQLWWSAFHLNFNRRLIAWLKAKLPSYVHFRGI